MVEIQNNQNKKVSRGLIKSVVIENGITITIEFECLYRNTGQIGKLTSEWTKVKNPVHYVNHINGQSIFELQGMSLLFAACSISSLGLGEALT